ncbi:hypothetical protein MKY69_10035 [Streptococcus sp. FSL R7-0212]
MSKHKSIQIYRDNKSVITKNKSETFEKKKKQERVTRFKRIRKRRK